jgi:hypothetical protein
MQTGIASGLGAIGAATLDLRMRSTGRQMRVAISEDLAAIHVVIMPNHIRAPINT